LSVSLFLFFPSRSGGFASSGGDSGGVSPRAPASPRAGSGPVHVPVVAPGPDVGGGVVEVGDAAGGHAGVDGAGPADLVMARLRAAPYARTITIGPGPLGHTRTLSRIVSRGVHVGWGANCNMHKNVVSNHLTCKVSLLWGGLSEESVLKGLTAWLLLGMTIPCDDPMGRTRHAALRPRMLAETEDRSFQDIQGDLVVLL
jgi:hypothetical protein